MLANGNRAILYIRVSTDKQAEHGHSLDAQRDRLIAYADRCGLVVVALIADGGESASSLKRPGLTEAIDRIKSGEADLLVATKSDRISRNLRDLLNLAADLAGSGASIATADGTFDTATPIGKAMTQMQGVFSELERELIAQRTREGMAAARRKGIPLGRPPVGFTYDNGKLVPSFGPTFDLGQLLYRWYREGMSLREIAAALNRRSTPAPQGGRWHPGTVRRHIRGFVLTEADDLPSPWA